MSAGAAAMTLSSLALVADSDQAFTLRITLARLARRTLDVQYYIWDDDCTSSVRRARRARVMRRVKA